MAKIRYEGQCCECCALMIANSDDSGCRDFYGHDHKPASLSERAVRLLDEENPEFADSPIPWDGWLVAGSDGEPVDGFCELCDGFSGYQYVYTFYVIR